MKRLLPVLILSLSIPWVAACFGGHSDPNSNTSGPPVYADAQTAFAEGERLFDSNKVASAVEAYRQATAMNPDFADAYFKLGVALSLLESDSKEAAKEDINANSSTKAVKTESQKAFEGAIDAYKKLLSASPKDASLHYNLGRSYAKLDKDSDAERALRESLRLSPDENEYRIELADILMKLAKYGEAAGLYKKAFEVDPENFDLEEKIEDALAGRKRQTFAGPSPSPSPSPGEGETAPAGNVKPEGNKK